MTFIEPESEYTRRLAKAESQGPDLSDPFPLPDIDPWEQPILDYMANFPGKLFRFWDVPTVLAAEFPPKDRTHEREIRGCIMKTFLRLVREKKLVRHKRKWVRIHEGYANNPQIILPL